MPPKPQCKGKWSKGVTVSVSPAKQMRKARWCKQVPVALTQALYKFLTEVDPASSQNTVFQKLMMMTMIADLTIRVFQASALVKTRQGRRLLPPQSTHPLPRLTEGGPRFTISHPPPPPRNWTCLQPLDLPAAMREWVAKRLQQQPIIRAQSTDEDSSTEEAYSAP